MARPRSNAPRFALTTRGTTYYVRWWTAGAWHRVSTGTGDRGEADRFLAQFVAGYGSPPAPAVPTIGQILAGYLRDRQGRIRTHDDAAGNAAHLTRHIGNLEPQQITTRQVRKYAADRHREGQMRGPPAAQYRKDISPGTIRREIMILRAALAWAVREKWLVTAPHIEAPAPAPSRERWLTGEEATRLLASAEAPHIKTFIALALFTGARTGAILELLWTSIDIQSRRISFGAGHGNKRRAKPLPINDHLLAALIEARTLATGTRVIEHGGKPVASIRKGFMATCRRANIEGVTPHALRHTAASWLIQQGISFEQAAAMLGNTAAMVEQVYGHFAPDWLDQASIALGTIPGLTVPPGPGNVISISDRKARKA